MEVKSKTEEFLFTTIRLEGQNKDGHTSTGTCFFFRVNRDGVELQFLVTNRHVVEGLHQGTFSIILSENNQPLLGHRVNVNLPTNFDQWWKFHSIYDLAIAPLGKLFGILADKGQHIFYKTFDESLIPKGDFLQGIDAFEEVIFIGYPSGLWDSSNHLPILRRGTTATPVYVDYENKKNFLIDASVVPGSSGSPVVLYDCSGIFRDKTSGKVKMGSRVYFLGLISHVFSQNENWAIKAIPAPTILKPIVQTTQMIDLGIVIKAQVISEFIDELIQKGTFTTGNAPQES